MRFLCLHGMGTNSEILRTQIGKIQSELPGHYAFDFVDGEYDTAAADGVEGIFPGPFCCYYNEPTASNVAAAHEMIDEVIATDGPYDAVLGFSQGAALAASYLLHYQESHGEDSPPFRLAVFFNASLPFTISQSYGLDLTEKFFSSISDAPYIPDTPAKPLPTDVFVETNDTAACRTMSTSTVSSKFSVSDGSDDDSYPNSETTSISDYGSDNEVKTPGSEFYDTQDYREWLQRLSESSDSDVESCSIRRFHPSCPSPQISIATAHICGKQDPYYSQGCALRQLCQSSRTVSLEHNEGHVVPRNDRTTKEMVGIIERAAQLSTLSV